MELQSHAYEVHFYVYFCCINSTSIISICIKHRQVAYHNNSNWHSGTVLEWDTLKWCLRNKNHWILWHSHSSPSNKHVHVVWINNPLLNKSKLSCGYSGIRTRNFRVSVRSVQPSHVGRFLLTHLLLF